MATIQAPTSALPSSDPVPPLENGDRLTSAEFERRYQAMPNGIRAELIEGVVYLMPSPVSARKHASPHSHLVWWLVQYHVGTSGLLSGDNGTLRLDLDNEPQPDAFLLILPEHGGQAKIDADDYVAGAPELVAEVASSSASYDLHAKLHAYRRNGVREYLVWRVADHAVDWFVLREGRFEPLPTDAAGRLRSEVFPGLWLDPAALLRGDLPAVNQALQEGLATPDHTAFVARLQVAGASA